MLQSNMWPGLALKGAEIVKADLNDKDSVVRALEGAYGVFAVTDCKYLAT